MAEPAEPPLASSAEPAEEAAVPTAVPEIEFAARVPPPQSARPLPPTHRAVFIDVENASRAEHVVRVLDHLALDWTGRGTELVAVGNWRVIGHETARILAQRGAQLVHSAPSAGVRDWSDLRIAVSAGAWLAAARPGDTLEIVTDDQAFDAVGDVAASLGIGFRRLSYRGLAGVVGEPVAEEAPSSAGRSRRRRRGGRRGRRNGAAPHLDRGHGLPAAIASAPNGDALDAEAHTAPGEEIVDVVRELLAATPGGVSLDTLSNTLKARGFRRPPGSPRLITRLRRIKTLEVGPDNAVRLVDTVSQAENQDAADDAALPVEAATSPPPAEGAPRRRRRRGGRRRRGRGRSGSAALAAP